MVRSSFRLFRVAGIDIGIHVSWLIIFALITWSVATGVIPQVLPATPAVEAWVLGAISAVLMFASVLIHELAHSLVAIRRGIAVHSITLFLFGGVSNLTGESKDPRTEFTIAIVGPLSSFVIAGIAYGLAIAIPIDQVSFVFGYLAIVNALLGGFNLIPGFPLDGGRVFRSIIWKATGSVRRATELAAGVGQLVGYGFLLWGLLRVFDGDLFGGLWTAAIGWFLQNAAAGSVQQLLFDQRLGGVRVRDAFTPNPITAPPGSSITELIEDYILARKMRAVPIADNGRLVGIVTLGDIQKVPPAARTSTTAAEIMTATDALVTIGPNVSLREAAEMLAEHSFDQVPVVETGRYFGMLTRADVVREFQVREALDLPAPGGFARTPPGPRPTFDDIRPGELPR